MSAPPEAGLTGKPASNPAHNQQKYSKRMMTRLTNWHLLWLGLGLTLLLLSLSVVWLNIALVDMSYRIEDLKSTVDREENLNDKLKLERLNLVSSRRLGELSRDFNLHHPETSRIRRLKP